MKLFYLLLIAAALAGFRPACAADIPEAGRIRIDGRLEDWGKIEWIPLTQTLDGDPVNISNAAWSLRWDEDGMLYIAVRYDDANIVLQNGYAGPGAQDCVEIYVRGDTGSPSSDYSVAQDNAQNYLFGLSKNQTSAWKKLAAFDRFPAHNPAKAAVNLEKNTFTYEIMVPLYDRFDASSRRRTSLTEVYVGLEIGADIAIEDAGSNGFAGILAENSLAEKHARADHIAEHRLEE